MKRIAIAGTQGVPAKYGGFETLVENIIGDNSSRDIDYTVFCSSKEISPQIPYYKGAKLKYIPIKANGAMSVIYDIICMLRSVRSYDVILLLGISGGLFLPFFRLFYRKKLIVNIDGMEYRRKKWNKFARHYLFLSEKAAVKHADIIIADNRKIQEYVWETYRRHAVLITYGGDNALRAVGEQHENDILNQYNLVAGQYSLTICRVVPENNVDLILEAFSKTNERYLFVGNWNRSCYGRELKKKYSQYGNIQILESFYDLDLLYVLRKNAKHYIHGHSAGGTNPSLVEAMNCQCNIIAFDAIFNKQTTEYKAAYFHTVSELQALIQTKVDNSLMMKEIAEREYQWATITKQYEELY